VAAFFQHEDDPVRALKAGINIISRLKNINVNSSIGVTTGKVFLGAVGSRLSAIGAPPFPANVFYIQAPSATSLRWLAIPSTLPPGLW
jgi:hypothetical protein